LSSPAVVPATEAARPHHRIWPKRLPLELVVPDTSLWFNLEVSAARFPDKPATVFFGQTLSYAELHAQSLAVAGWLQSVGVKKGDRVAIFMQNCPQYLAAFYAVVRADAVVVVVNPMNRAEEFKHYITDPQTRAVICSADLAATVAAANRALPDTQRLAQVLVTRYADAMPAGDIDPAEAPPAAMLAWLRSDPPLPEDGGATFIRWNEVLVAGTQPGPHTAMPDDLVLLPYTSGTTGAPKGCMHTHRTLMANAVAGRWMFSGPESVGLTVVPMFHITGLMYGVLSAVFVGSTGIVMPRWDRELAGRLMSRHRVTHWVCIPTMVIDLFASPNYRSFDLSSLVSLSGGGPSNP